MFFIKSLLFLLPFTGEEILCLFFFQFAPFANHLFCTCKMNHLISIYENCPLIELSRNQCYMDMTHKCLASRFPEVSNMETLKKYEMEIRLYPVDVQVSNMRWVCWLAGEFLEDFIRQNQLPLVVPINFDTLKLLNDDKRKIVLTIVDDTTDEKSPKLVKALRAAANANRDLVFGYVGVEQWGEFVDTFAVSKGSELPKLLIWDGTEEYHIVSPYCLHSTISSAFLLPMLNYHHHHSTPISHGCQLIILFTLIHLSGYACLAKTEDSFKW